MTPVTRIIDPKGDAHSYRQLHQFIHDAGVRHSYVAAQLAEVDFLNRPLVKVLGYFDDGELISALLLGANFVPIHTNENSRQAFAQALEFQRFRPASIVGQAEEVLDFWRLLEPIYGPAREVRPRQPFMVIDQIPNLPFDEQVRYSRHEDLDVLFDACVAMFTEELGVSPIAQGPTSYRNRIESLVHAKRSFIHRNDKEVIFKAEIGSLGNGTAHVQGVWVNPAYRGQGFAVPALVAVLRHILTDTAQSVTLYVNDFNERALAVYRKVGMQQVDLFATILL